MSKNESLSKKATLLSIGSFANTLISVISMMVVTRMLDKEDFATYKQTFLAFNFLLPFLALGLTQGIYYYLPVENKRVRGIIYDVYFIYLVIGVIFSLFIFFGGNLLLAARFNNPDVAPLMLWQIPYAVIVLMTQCTAAILNIRNRIRIYIIFNVISALFSSIALIVATLLFHSAKSAVVVITVSNLVSGTVSIVLSIRSTPKDDRRISFRFMKKIIVFSLPIGIAGMIGTITSQMDGLFISMMKSTEEYAVYVVAAVEVPLIGVVLSSISAAILPEMRARIASGNLKAGGEMFVIAAKRTACLTLPLMCFLALWSREFISFMYGEQYLAAAPIFTVYLLYFLTRICYTGPVFAALGMGKYILIRTLVSCGLNAIFTYFFILWIGSIGAAIGTILSGMLIMVLSIFPVLSKKIGIPKRELYPIITVIKLLVVGFMSAAISKIVVDMVFSIKSVEYADHLDVALPLFSHNVFRLGAGGVLFFAIYVFLVLLTTRSEYDWLIIKLKIKARVIFWKRKGT